jgi:adenylyl-sulfate kinase
MAGTHLYPVHSVITSEQRTLRMAQQPLLVWFTGLSGSGKSTLAVQLEQRLFERGFKVFFLDGDALRTGLNHDLDFSEQGRSENIRRSAEVCKILLDSGLVVISAFISPLHKDRETVKQIVGPLRYFEVYVQAPLEVCEARDVKGLYKKARSGEIKNFTGIDAPYQEPTSPNLVIQTAQQSVDESVNVLLNAILPKISL